MSVNWITVKTKYFKNRTKTKSNTNTNTHSMEFNTHSMVDNIPYTFRFLYPYTFHFFNSKTVRVTEYLTYQQKIYIKSMYWFRPNANEWPFDLFLPSEWKRHHTARLWVRFLLCNKRNYGVVGKTQLNNFGFFRQKLVNKTLNFKSEEQHELSIR